MKCPLCGKNLVKQSYEDSCGYEPDLYCQEAVELNGKIYNHYRKSFEEEKLVMMVPPYRILNEDDLSKVGIPARYKTGKQRHYFKTVIKCPTIHPDTEDKLRNRIKLLLLMS